MVGGAAGLQPAVLRNSHTHRIRRFRARRACVGCQGTGSLHSEVTPLTQQGKRDRAETDQVNETE